METATIADSAAASPNEAAPIAPDSTVFSDKSPLDGSPLSAIEATPIASVAKVLTAARSAQSAWAERSPRDRAECIARVKPRLLERAEAIGELLRKECGKPIEEAVLAEVLPNADLVDYWTASIEELLDDATIELDAIAYPGKSGRIRRDPRGVVALVTPWNYPVAIPLRTIVPALLAGNAVVFKPSEVTPRAGALIGELFEGIVPSGVLQVVQGDGALGSALIEGGVDLVVFTGSVATGKKVAVKCAEALVPCSLELGGKDAAIVLRDANLERTARGLVWGAFTNAGQNCASIERVYVERPIAERLIARVVELTRELRPGVDTAVLTTSRQATIVRTQVERAIADGAKLLAGGPPEEGSRAFPPTVLTLEHEDTPLMQEETFGPILPIVIVEDEASALEKTNASRFGLTTSLWTKRIEHANELAAKLRSGVVTINNHGFTAAIPGAPWVGTGDSGFGITNSPHALSELTRTRFILEDRSSASRELWWYPYTPVLRTIALAMASLRGGAGLLGRIGALFKLIGAFPKRLAGG